MIRSISLMLLFVMLTACGTADTTDTTASDADDTAVATSETVTETDDADTDGETVVRISGAEDFVFEQDLTFGCVEDRIHIQTFSQSPKLDLYLPASIEEGTYQLADYDANSDPIYVEGQAVLAISGETNSDGERDFYFQNNEGQLDIQSMPSDTGEFFVATLNGTLRNSGDDATITIDAELNIEVESFLLMDCQY